MDAAVGGVGRLPVHASPEPVGCLCHRHAAADRQRIAARRARLLLHAHRRHRPVPPHARQGRVLPDGVGRQRAADRAPRAELLRRALRSVAAVRPLVHAARAAGEAADLRVAAELHRVVRAPDRGRRAGLRAALENARAVGRLVDDVRDDRQARAARLTARLSETPETPPGLSGRSADAVGHRLQDRGRAGRARRSRDTGRVSPHQVQARRCGAGLQPCVYRNRHDAPRADPRLRRARRASRRCAVSAAVREGSRDAAVRRARAGAGASAGRSRKGQRHRDDLHLRRRHRRDLVARAEPAGARRDSGRRHAARRHVGRAGLGVGGRGSRAALLRRAGAPLGGEGAREDRRAAARIRRPRRRAAADHARREVLREGRPAARDHHEPAVVHQDDRVPRGAARARPRAEVASGIHGSALRELGERPERRLVRQPPAVLRRAVPGLVSARRGRPRRIRPADSGARGSAAGRSVDRRARRLSRGSARRAGRLRRRSRT